MKFNIYIRLISVAVMHLLQVNQLAGQSDHHDSLTGRAYPAFDQVSKWHRVFFGENYRKEWAAATRLPVIQLSEIHGGLRPLKEGGGLQTLSLRLSDTSGNEWVLRSVVKYPDTILPEDLRKTFVAKIVTDAMSAQHPYSALVVPPIANAAGIPHADPVIGIVAPDTVLGIYGQCFANTICLLEKWQPAGRSVDYIKMYEELNAGNNNHFDSSLFLRERILDLFIGDWDRHDDQWRFIVRKNKTGEDFIPVPRDRDQVFYINQGVFPFLESRPYVQPFFEGFGPRVRNTGTFFFTSTLMYARLVNQFSYTDWMKITSGFVSAITDSVLAVALSRLPESSRKLRYEKLMSTLKARRADLPRAMSFYYFFLNKSVFIQTGNQGELIRVKDTLENKMVVTINRLFDDGKVKHVFYSKTFDPLVTKEIRFFIGKGNDSIMVDNARSDINLRFSGLEGEKRFHVVRADRKIKIFEMQNAGIFSGNTARIEKHISNDSSNTAILPGNLFNVVAPVLSVGYDSDDGILLGGQATFYRNIGYTTTSFNLKSAASFQQFGFIHAFSTRAFEAKYNAGWNKLIGQADLLIHARAFAPNNTQNYFGTGNASQFNKSGDYKAYYRARYGIYQLSTALQWQSQHNKTFSAGPSVIFYTYDSSDNTGRYIATPGAVQTYDSNSLSKSKLHAGIILNYKKEFRNNPILPTKGYFIDLKLQGYAGLNSYSESYAQLFIDLGFYKSLDKRNIFILADRAGAAANAGHAAFYQAMSLGGQGNLLGFRKNRFSGQYLVYNNLEARIRLANFMNYILPGQMGLIGLYDVGRVWQKGDPSNQWHNGVGAGFYFAPAQLALFQFVASYSEEGWYPVFSMGFRF